MQTHLHPISGIPIAGVRLTAGAILQIIDKYDSTDGNWQTCPVVGGLVPNGNHVVWVRPGDLSPDGKDLLRFLTCYPGELYSHIVWRAYGFVVIPKRDWNAYTATMNLATPQVRHPECVQELRDFGYLAFDDFTGVYSVTPTGREKAKQL